MGATNFQGPGKFRGGFKGRPQPGTPEAVSPTVQASALVRTGAAGARHAKEMELGRLMVASPEVVLAQAESLAELDLKDASLDRLRHELLNLAASGSSLEKAGVQAHFTRKGMADLLARFAGGAAASSIGSSAASSVASPGSAGWTIEISGNENRTLTAAQVIVATGSSPRALPGVAFDNKLVLDNDGALALAEVPATLGVIGAGVIGLEMGSVWRRLGAKVTVLEALPAFLGAADEQVAKEAWKLFAKQGLAIELGVKIGGVTVDKDVAVEYSDASVGRLYCASAVSVTPNFLSCALK